MTVTAELSLYPLTKDYEEPIILFIKKLKEHKALQVMTHSMSTYVTGDNTEVFSAINSALEAVDSQGFTVSLVLKIINKKLPVDAGFLEF